MVDMCVRGAHVLEVDDGLLEEGDEDGLGVRELGHQLDLQAKQTLGDSGEHRRGKMSGTRENSI